MKHSIHSLLEKMVWLGHDGFRIDTGKTIYFDPYQITTDIPADIIFITHDHYDHCSPEDIQKIQKIDTVIVTSESAGQNLDGDIRIVKPGDRLQIESIGVEVVPDIALLPVSGTYVMTAEEAAEAARAINPAVVVPMHYDSIVGSVQDAERFARLLAGKIEVHLIPRE